MADDLISRADAIEALEKAKERYFDRAVVIARMQDILRAIPSAQSKQGEWIPCEERMPKTDGSNEINEYDVLLAVRPKKHPEREPQIYIGKLRPVKGDDGSGNFWGVKTEPCEWTIWGWSYFQEPEVLAWTPLPQPYSGARMNSSEKPNNSERSE